MAQDLFFNIEKASNGAMDKRRRRILVPEEQSHVIISPQKIVYCSKWILDNETELKVKYSLSFSLEVLGKQDFFMVNTSTVVNLSKVFRIFNQETAQVRLINGLELPISVRRRRELLEILRTRY